MACSDCGGGCSCVIVSGRGTVVRGSGVPSNPYSIDSAGPISPDWQAASQRTWIGGVESLADLVEPETLEVTLNGNVTSITLPTWLNTVSGIITLVITNTGAFTVAFPGLVANGAAIGVTPNGTTLVHLLWTGQRWIALLGAANLS